MQQDETSETIYITTQALNQSQVNGNSLACNINLQSNPIVNNLNDWNVYLQSLTVTTAELPYFNAFRNIIDPVNDVMNFSITFWDSANNNNTFVVPAYGVGGNFNAFGVGLNNGAGAYQGVCIFLVYQSENLPTNPGSRAYYNVHSINQFMGFVNAAINQMLGYWQNNGPAPAANSM